MLGMAQQMVSLIYSVQGRVYQRVRYTLYVGLARAVPPTNTTSG